MGMVIKRAIKYIVGGFLWICAAVSLGGNFQVSTSGGQPHADKALQYGFAGALFFFGLLFVVSATRDRKRKSGMRLNDGPLFDEDGRRLTPSERRKAARAQRKMATFQSQMNQWQLKKTHDENSPMNPIPGPSNPPPPPNI